MAQSEKLTINELLDALTIPDWLPFSAWLEHLPFAAHIITKTNPEVFVELGTHYGASYAMFCEAVLQNKLGTHCFAIDTWKGDPHASFYDEDVFNMLNQYHKRFDTFSNLIRSTFNEALDKFADGSIDLLHIDGYHTYEATSENFHSWLPKMSSLGIIVIHDTNVHRDDFGVWKLWNEIKTDYDYTFEFFHGHGLGIISVGDEIPDGIAYLFKLSNSEKQAIRNFFSFLGQRWLTQYRLDDYVQHSKKLEQELHQVMQYRDQLQNDLNGRPTQDQIDEVNAELHLVKQDINKSHQERDAIAQERDAVAQEQARLLVSYQNMESKVTQLVNYNSSEILTKNSTLTNRLLRRIPVRGLRSLKYIKKAYILRKSHLIDYDWYLTHYVDVGVSGNDPLWHYLRYGASEGRNPNPYFDTRWYLQQNPDVAEANVNPLVHYYLHGAKEGRDPSPLFSTSFYLAKYNDVLQSGMNPLTHYLLHGFAEGRELKPVFSVGNQVGDNDSFEALAPPLNAPFDLNKTIKPVSQNTRTEPVDIVICIHNALEDVRRCVESVLESTTEPYSVILIDDGSKDETRDYVQTYKDHPRVTVYRNEVAQGYTFAANIGLQASTAPWVILLNSDTIVSPKWVDKMWRHGKSDESIGVVGPLANSASWQSVPKIEDYGDWAINKLPDGMSVTDMDELVARVSLGFVELPFINGFCYMIRRSVIDKIGYFDEEAFGAGYGEENDYSIRVRKAGFKLGVATDTYVFHAVSKSYSSERRRKLEKNANIQLASKHDPVTYIHPHVKHCQKSLSMASMRARIDTEIQRQKLIREGRQKYQGKHVAFILPTATLGGGANVVIQESLELKKMGVSVTILNLNSNLSTFPSVDGLNLIGFHNAAELTTHIQENTTLYDAVVCTLYETVYWLPNTAKEKSDFVFGYYVQDYEPYFFEESDGRYERAKQSYTLHSNMKLFTKTVWNQKEVKAQTGVEPKVIGCSVAQELFYPSESQSDSDIINIVAMVRPSSLRRGPYKTIQVMEKLNERYGDKLRFHIFGAKEEILNNLGLSRPWINNYELLDRDQINVLLGQSQIFIDASQYQAMGLTALESMLCGCAVVGPLAGGMDSFVENNVNGVIVDTTDIQNIVTAVSNLIEHPHTLENMQLEAIKTANNYLPASCALKISEFLFDEPFYIKEQNKSAPPNNDIQSNTISDKINNMPANTGRRVIQYPANMYVDTTEKKYDIIVYQMGKVASTSIVHSLNKSIYIDAYQSHSLGSPNLKQALDFVLDIDLHPFMLNHGLSQMYDNLHLTRLVKEYLNGKHETKLGIVSITRDPLDWFRSQMVQNLEGYMPSFVKLSGVESEQELTPDDILMVIAKLKQVIKDTLINVDIPLGMNYRERLNNYYIPRLKKEVEFAEAYIEHLRNFTVPFIWYQKHMDKLFDLDFDNFKMDDHYKTIERNWGFLHIFKYESISDGYRELTQYIGEPDLSLQRENISAKKLFSNEIKKAFEDWKNDGELIQLIQSDYTRKFGYYIQD